MSDEPNPNTDKLKPALIIGGAWVIALAAVWMYLLQFSEGWDFGIFLGRFHVIVVHAPIALLAVALAMELCRSIKPLRQFSKGVTTTLWFGALGAGASVILGLIFMVSAQAEGWVMDRHKWTGIAVAVLAFASLAMKLAEANRGLYLAVLTVTVFVTGYTGHMGGVLTHGKGFLAEYAPDPLKPFLGGEVVEEADPDTIDVAALLLYDDVLQPVFDAKCVDCHGAEKVKGKLRMDSFEELAKGGDIGESFVAGDVEASELHYRVAGVEPGDDDFMPPGKEDEPMTPEEIAIMALWIEEGASPTMTVAEAAPEENLLAMIEAIVKGEEGPVEEPIVAWTELTPEQQKERLDQVYVAAEEIGFSVMPLSAEDERWRS
ncbi:MAG: c-type cytochrome domain-containing protein [Verrucomicrobiota bacterium]